MHHPNLSHFTCKSSSTAHGTTEFMFATTAAKSREKHHNLAHAPCRFLPHRTCPASENASVAAAYCHKRLGFYSIPWHQGHPHTATSDIFLPPQAIENRNARVPPQVIRHWSAALATQKRASPVAVKKKNTCGSVFFKVFTATSDWHRLLPQAR